MKLKKKESYEMTGKTREDNKHSKSLRLFIMGCYSVVE